MNWDPRHIYRPLFAGDLAAMDQFLATVCTPEWIRRQDEGQPVAQAVAELSARHPSHSTLIEAYEARWMDMLGGIIDASVDLLFELKRRGIPLYGLTNLPAEKYPLLRQRLTFLECFDAVIVSGSVGVAKPNPAIYTHLLDTCRLEPARTLYIDDVIANVEAGRALGLRAVQFVSPEKLRSDLMDVGAL